MIGRKRDPGTGHRFGRTMGPRTYTVQSGKLTKNDIRFWMRGVSRLRCEQIVEGFFPVPYSIDAKAQFSNSFCSDCLVDCLRSKLVCKKERGKPEDSVPHRERQ